MKFPDLSLGVIEIVAVLFPGAIASVVGVLYLPDRARQALLDLDSTERSAIVVLAAWVMGQLLFRLGSELDRVYDLQRRLSRGGARTKAFLAADAIHQRRASDGMPTFAWAKAWFAAVAPEHLAEVERLEASSKFFRGMTVLAGAVAAAAWLVPDLLRPAETFGIRRIPFALLASALTWLCFDGFCDYRKKATARAYLGVILADAAERERRD